MKVKLNSTTNEAVGEFLEKEVEERDKPIIPYEDQKIIRELFAGLSIYDTVTGLTGFNGQIFLVDTGSTRYICAYINGTLYKTTIT